MTLHLPGRHHGFSHKMSLAAGPASERSRSPFQRSPLQEGYSVGRKSFYLLAVMGLVILTLDLFAQPSAISQEKATSPKWEYKAVPFDRDEKSSTKKLNALASEGWEYIRAASS
jgi:hypothetical protein